MCKNIQIKEERISTIEYIEFLKRTDLGSQYPKERFEERIAKLVDHVSISLVARNKDNQIVGVLFYICFDNTFIDCTSEKARKLILTYVLI